MHGDIDVFRGTPRRSRKACLSEMGEKQFGFNKEYELLKYKYLTLERLTRREWEQCQRCAKCMRMPYKHHIWREEIREKYIGLNRTELAEFKRYLELCLRNKRGHIPTRNTEIETSMYEDYQKVIDEIIELKKW